MKNILLALVVLCGFSTIANAKINPWQHCGIGAMVFDDNEAAAAISNIIWDLGTTAVSSKISSEDSCNGEGATAAKFLMKTYPTVASNVAKGSGQHISAMLNILGCDATSHNAAIKNIRSSFANSVSSTSDFNRSQKAENLYNIVDAEVSTTCGA